MSEDEIDAVRMAQCEIELTVVCELRLGFRSGQIQILALSMIFPGLSAVFMGL